ncbi:MAG TPA: tRNA modification GTPase [Nannocystis sp.]
MASASAAGEQPTIVGVATGTPDGGVAIVRLSGSRAMGIARALCGELPTARHLARRRVKLDERGVVEDALVVVMPGPGSFTGEDVVELHVHAGARNVASVVTAVLGHGAVAADAGEFSRRAFEHGRLSLEQAEGIAALIAARTDAALEQARRLVAGELGREVSRLAAEIHALRCEVEANLDFSEDVEAGDLRRWSGEISGFAATMQAWIGRFEAGRRSRERARVVLAGPPNAGKSAVFNALLGRPRAIVSPVPGTTRDYVEAELMLGSHEVVLVDTAGLREAMDLIEDAGISRSRDQIGGADLVVWIEAADGAGAEAVAAGIRVENKRDLGCRRPDWVGASAAAGEVGELRTALHAWVQSRTEHPWIGLARHRDRVADSGEALEDAAAVLAKDGPLEIAAFQLGVAEQRLAEVTGRGTIGPISEDVLKDIFSRFCIGK